MRYLLLLPLCFFLGCAQETATPVADDEFQAMLANYYEERLVLSPLEATYSGDNRYNDQLHAHFALYRLPRTTTGSETGSGKHHDRSGKDMTIASSSALADGRPSISVSR